MFAVRRHAQVVLGRDGLFEARVEHLKQSHRVGAVGPKGHGAMDLILAVHSAPGYPL